MTKQEIAQQLWSIAGAFPMSVQARAELVKLANDIDGREPCDDECEDDDCAAEAAECGMYDPIGWLLEAMPPGSVIKIELPRE